MILDEAIQYTLDKYHEQIENLTIKDVNIGINLTSVELSDYSLGVTSTLIEGSNICIKELRDFGDYSPLQIKWRRVIDLLASNKKNIVLNTLKIAVLTAITSKLYQNYKCIENTDTLDLVDLNGNKTITIVGAFQSYIKKILSTNNKLHILELEKEMIQKEHLPYFVDSKDAKNVLPDSDIVIITGLTILNNTLDELLSHCKQNQQIIITGPTSSIPPELLFNKGIDIIGSVKIDNKENLFSIVSQAGSTFHLFNYGAQKICIVNERK